MPPGTWNYICVNLLAVWAGRVQSILVQEGWGITGGNQIWLTRNILPKPWEHARGSLWVWGLFHVAFAEWSWLHVQCIVLRWRSNRNFPRWGLWSLFGELFGGNLLFSFLILFCDIPVLWNLLCFDWKVRNSGVHCKSERDRFVWSRTKKKGVCPCFWWYSV